MQKEITGNSSGKATKSGFGLGVRVESDGKVAGEGDEIRPARDGGGGDDTEALGSVVGDLEVGVDEAALSLDPADEVRRLRHETGGGTR